MRPVSLYGSSAPGDPAVRHAAAPPAGDGRTPGPARVAGNARCVDPLTGRCTTTTGRPYDLACALTRLRRRPPSTVVVRVVQQSIGPTAVSEPGRCAGQFPKGVDVILKGRTEERQRIGGLGNG
ncbi:hypothetical protein OHT57_43355 [Streptomyces sp. NBC_00285]|uniref:hypothetical protein n=1 Tax=Streptomyces sp. NBC_00285 TaxID=2975700 RepID=UPI002E2D3C83|nr:hypothetical protein [Streptomyces sp. NBC_00285]